MSTQVQLRRGSTAQHESFTGALAEVTVNVDTHALHVHDGSTAGGFATATAAQGAKADTALQPNDSAASLLLPGLGTGVRARNISDRRQDDAISAFDFLSASEQADAIAGTGSLDHTASLNKWLQAGIDERHDLYMPAGQFNIGSSGQGLLLDHSAIADADRKAPSVFGPGPGTCKIVAADGNYIAFHSKGANGAGTGVKWLTISGLHIVKRAQDGIGEGFVAEGYCFGTFRDLRTAGFQNGQHYKGVFSSLIESPRSFNNAIGMLLEEAMGSDGVAYCPNAITILQPYLSTNNTYGLHAHRPAALAVRGGSIENNGATGAYQCGAWIENAGYEGAFGALFDGVYFEDNGGKADIYLTNTENNSVYSVRNCLFSRIQNGRFTTSNIRTAFSGSLRQHISLGANAFSDLGTYVPDVSRPFIKHENQVPTVWPTVSKDKFSQTPRFEAVGNSDPITVSADNTVLSFAATNSNSGSYDTNTYKFTVPYPGRYLFVATLGLNSVTGQGSICFGKNGAQDTTGVVRFTSVAPACLTRIMDLAAGDIIDVRSFLSTGQAFSYRGFISSFIGMKISA